MAGPDLGHLQGKNVMSVEELEANMNQARRYPSGGSGRLPQQASDNHKPHHAHHQPPAPHPMMAGGGGGGPKEPATNSEEDMSAFKKLVSFSLRLVSQSTGENK